MTPDDETLQRAIETATSLKAGTWESVEVLAILALQSGDPAFLDVAATAARRLKSGTWSSVRALSWLARAQRELGAG